MDPTPFLEFSVLRVTEREADLIKPFTKENFNSSIIQRHAEEVISLEKVTALVNDLLRNPSENFIRFILSELELVGGRVTASVVSRFEPIIKKSIQTALLGMMTKSIQQEIAPAATAPVTAPATPEPPQARQGEKALPAAQVESAPQRVVLPKPVAGQPVEPSSGAKDGAIVTTEEELEVFRAISAICAESSSKVPIKHKDSTNFFAINLGPVRTWFLRLFAGSRRKSFVVRLPAAQAEPLARNVQVEPVPENPDKCRVYFSSVADVERLRPLILRAHEDAVRRQASGGADGDESAE